jgi:hypothetical protein
VAPTACAVAGAVDALAGTVDPLVGEAAESVGVGAGGDVEPDGDGVGVSDGDGAGDDCGGLPVAVGCGLGFELQLSDGCGDAAEEPVGAAVLPFPDEAGWGWVLDVGPLKVWPPPACWPGLPL